MKFRLWLVFTIVLVMIFLLPVMVNSVFIPPDVNFYINNTSAWDSGTKSVSQYVYEIESQYDNPNVSANVIQLANMYGTNFTYPVDDLLTTDTWRLRTDNIRGIDAGPMRTANITNIDGHQTLYMYTEQQGGVRSYQSVNMPLKLTGDFDFHVKVNATERGSNSHARMFAFINSTDFAFIDLSSTNDVWCGIRIDNGQTSNGDLSAPHNVSYRINRTGRDIACWYDEVQGRNQWTKAHSRTGFGEADVYVEFESISNNANNDPTDGHWWDFNVTQGTWNETDSVYMTSGNWTSGTQTMITDYFLGNTTIGFSDFDFDHYIDKVKWYTQEQKQLGDTYYRYDNNLTAYYKFEGNANDELGLYDMTNNGADFVSGKFGQSADFVRASNDYMNGSSLYMGDQYTITLWSKLDTIANEQILIAGQGGDGAGRYQGYIYYHPTHDVYKFHANRSDGGADSTTIITDTDWHFIAAICDGTTRKISIDGGTFDTYDGGYVGNWDTDRYIGRRDDGRYFDGVIDDVAYFNRTLSLKEINELYQGTLKDKLDDTYLRYENNLVSYFKLEDNTNDELGLNTMTNDGVSYTNTIFNKGFIADSTGEHVNITASNSLSPLTHDWGVSMWFRTSDSDGGIILYNPTDDAVNIRMLTDGTLQLYMRDNAPGFDVSYIETDNAYNDDLWHHLVASWEGGSIDDWTPYIDGQEVPYTVGTDDPIPTVVITVDWNMFYDVTNARWDLQGEIDDIAFFNKSLSPEEVADIYNSTKAKFVGGLSLNTLIEDDDLISYYQFEYNPNDYKGVANMTNNGADFISGKFGQGAHFVSDESDYMDDSSPYLDNNYTITLWSKLNDTDSEQIVVAGQGGDGTGRYQGYIYYHGVQNVYKFHANRSDGGVDSTTVITDNNWHFIVAVCSGTQRKISIDGGAFDIYDGGFIGNWETDRYIARRNDGRYFNGTLDDIAYFNRTLSIEEVKLLYNVQKTGGMFWNSSLYFDDNIISYWQFEGSVNDTKGLSDGTNNGAIYTSNCKFDGCYNLTKSDDDYINIDTLIPYVETDTTGTISFWANTPSDTNDKNVVFATSLDGHADNTRMFIDLDEGAGAEYVRFAVNVDSGMIYDVNTPADNLDDYRGEWIHVAVVQDGTGISIYINGTNQTLTINTGTTPSAWFKNVLTDATRDSDVIQIGALRDDGTIKNPFDGKIDDVVVFNRSLSADEILALYNIQAYKFIDNNHLTSGDLTEVDEDFKIELFLKGNGTSSPIVESIFGYYGTAIPPVPPVYDQCYYPSNSTYINITSGVIVQSDEYLICNDTNSDVTGDIELYGNLTFSNFDVLFQMTSDGEYNTTTYSGSSLIIDNQSNISSNNPSYEYDFRASGNLSINNSFISECGYAGGTLGLSIRSNSATIYNNTIEQGYHAIILSKSNYSFVSRNTITSGVYHGITMQSGASNNTITYNNVSNRYYGVGITLDTVNNTVQHNILSNGNTAGIAIELDANDNLIENNTCNSNTYGIHTFQSYNNTIKNNTANLNTYGLYPYQSEDNVFDDNIARYNSRGVMIDVSADNNNFANNIFSGNGRGISLDDSDSNIFENNNITNSTVYSVYVNGTSVDNIFTNININETNMSFTGFKFSIEEIYDVNRQTKEYNVSSYITLNSEGAGAWLDINLSYNETLVTERGLYESDLRLWKYNGAWNELITSTVDTVYNYVNYNVTSFSDFGIFPTECAYTSGNFNVTDTMECLWYEQDYEITGNITIYGNLTLNNTDMTFNMTGDGSSVMTTYSGSNLYIYNQSNITVNDSTKEWNFYVNSTNFIMNNSHLSECGHGGGASSNGIRIYSDNSILENNTIVNDFNGIYIDNSDNHIVFNNTIDSSTNYGIVITTSNNTTISYNDLSGNANGLYLMPTSNSSIHNNTMTIQAIGIQLGSNSQNNDIKDNIITHGTNYALHLPTGHNNTINNNTIEYMGAGGMYINGHDNIIESNNITSTTHIGIYVFNGHRNNFLHNNITNVSTTGSTAYGIRLSGSDNNVFTSTIINGSAHYDFDCRSGSDNTTVYDMTFNQTTASFQPYDVLINQVYDINRPAKSGNISVYLEANDVTSNAWLYLNLSYNETLVTELGFIEQFLELWEYKVSWILNSSHVNINDNYVYQNITDFSIWGIFGGEGYTGNDTIIILHNDIYDTDYNKTLEIKHVIIVNDTYSYFSNESICNTTLYMPNGSSWFNQQMTGHVDGVYNYTVNFTGMPTGTWLADYLCIYGNITSTKLDPFELSDDALIESILTSTNVESVGSLVNILIGIIFIFIGIYYLYIIYVNRRFDKKQLKTIKVFNNDN